MSKEPERELRVMVHPPKKLVELILLADGLPLGSVQFTQEQAENHARAVIDAIERLQQRRSLIVPGGPGGLSTH
jgi:hypothetical protein